MKTNPRRRASRPARRCFASIALFLACSALSGAVRGEPQVTLAGPRVGNVRLENNPAGGQLPYERTLSTGGGGVLDTVSFRNVRLNEAVVNNVSAANITRQGAVTHVTFEM